MFKKRMAGLALVLAVAALVAMPVVTQAAVPRWVLNGRLATTIPERGFSIGTITLHNEGLGNLQCQTFEAFDVWNEVKEGTERGFKETTGYATGECKASSACPGIFVTAEGPPEARSEKAHKTGSTSLPWTGELTEKEGGRFLLTHHVKVWVVMPPHASGKDVEPCPEEGMEIPFEEMEGPTEKAAGDELAFKYVNGARNGLSPSKEILEGEKTEKSGKPETGRLESAAGPGYITGSLVAAGSNFQLITAK